jgi:hypothetical protein
MIKAFLVALIVCFFCSTDVIGGQESIPAPIFREGDTWQFRIMRKIQASSSTERKGSIYELSFTHGSVRMFEM